MLNEASRLHVARINERGHSGHLELQEGVEEDSSQESAGEWGFEDAGHDDVGLAIARENDSANQFSSSLISDGDIGSVPSQEVGKSLLTPLGHALIFMEYQPRAALLRQRGSRWSTTARRCP